MSTEQTGGTGQNSEEQKVGDDLTTKMADLEKRLNATISERDSFKTQARDFKAAADAAKALETQLADERKARTKVESDFNGFKDTVKQEKLGTHLTTALEAAGAKSISTVMKLLDKSQIEFDENGNVKQDSLASAIEAVRTSDPILFGDPPEGDEKKGKSGGSIGGKPPAVKAAADGVNTASAYEAEMNAAKTQKDVERIARKYNVTK